MEAPELHDDELVRRVRGGDRSVFPVLVRRHNGRLYRAARAILKDPAEAEDVVQDAWVRAYEALPGFEGRAPFASWLARICVHESLARLRKRQRVEPTEEEGERHMGTAEVDPERRAAARELTGLVEKLVDDLPEHYRLVFVLRAVEELSVAEVAGELAVEEDTVKSRFHRARKLLQERILERVEPGLEHAFELHLSRCDRIVEGVLARIDALEARRTDADR